MYIPTRRLQPTLSICVPGLPKSIGGSPPSDMYGDAVENPCSGSLICPEFSDLRSYSH